MELKELIISLSSLMTVSGSEYRAIDKLCELVGEYFDEVSSDRVGNIRLIKRCQKSDPALVMIDTHFDEIGMMVTKIHEGGFLSVTSIGGLNLAVLQASDVIIYGKKTIRGVIASTPPHLKKASNSDKLTELSDILIDTGYDKEELEGFVDLGTPIGFSPVYSELLGGSMVGKSFDNKACAACAIYGVINTPREALAADVCILLSVHEETVNTGGVAVGGFELMPDYAMVIDVNLAKVPDSPRYESVDFGGGVSISISAITDRRLTRMTEELCKANNIKFTRVAAPSNTGTNTPALNLVGRGIPTADVGLPLKSMHTPSEVISEVDAKELSRLVSAFVSSNEIKEAFSI
jgi:endoglucanase